MPTFTPTGGWTSCTVEYGAFINTMDGSTANNCQFKRDQSCLSEWTWDNPVDVNYLRIHSRNYGEDNHIHAMWGRVDGSWVEIASGIYHLTTGVWYNVPDSACLNCTGIRIGQTHIAGASKPWINEVLIDYEEVPATSCSASFQETSVEVGDTIHADFTWSNAVYRGFPYYHYAVMNIKDPNGNVCAQHFELTKSSGSKSVSCVTDMAGTWECQIGVWQGVFYVTCSDTVPVSEGDFTLDEALTCLWVSGYNDHGPLVTEFDIGTAIYAYSEIHGPDIYGHTVRHEWWYKEAGATEFTKKWEYGWTCSGNYTEWAQWTWWTIGGAYGPGEGYIKVYFDDVLIGKTNNYTVTGEVTGGIDYSLSKFYLGPFDPNTDQIVMYLVVKNTGTKDGTINWRLYEYPGETGENLLASGGVVCVAGTSCIVGDIVRRIPDDGTWPLGVKVKGWDEVWPSWP